MTSTAPDLTALELLSQLWGKADPKVGSWHPAMLHMLDVAAVALELMHDGLPRALVEDLQTPAPGQRLSEADVAFVVACHDLGKLTPGFQAKVPERRQALAALGLDFPPNARRDHAESTSEVGPHLLEAAGVDAIGAEYACVAVGAHHGRFIPRETRVQLASRVGGTPWARAREAAVPQLVAALGARPERLASSPSDQWLMVVAGLTVVADWIGSDTGYFPYCPGTPADVSYVAAARQKAARALMTLGWRGWAALSVTPSFGELFPALPSPNAMQQTVINALADVDGPVMLLVEAPTGGGKTEAALYAAEQQIARAALGGLYFALPTQATSNQMFGRVGAFLSQRYPKEHVNLHLLHALRDLNPDYAAISTQSVDGAEGVGTRSAALAADAWFHGKKRGLLSPFAVGTVDQALLAALQSKHFHLRMLGLARKVLVIDEVHAYDAFMSRILDRLLQWLAALGSSVVLLSATLPRQRRQELLAAWAGAAPSRPVGSAVDADAPYPRVSLARRGDSNVRALAIPRDQVPRTVRLEAVAGTDVPRLLCERVGDGGCAAWVCNTVGEAQAAYRELRGQLGADELLLFHARFPVEERLAREERVLQSLSKTAPRPHRLVVVATQVIEQSLDIDFDLMVSSLAPIDLLIQRAGRLHRHPQRDTARPAGLRLPTLLLVEPDSVDGETRFGPSEFVYHAHVLLRTWWTLRRREQWTIPDQADALIDAVYEPAPVPDEATEAMASRWRQTADDLKVARRLAKDKGGEHLVPAPQPPEAEQSFVELAGKELEDPEDAPQKHSDFLARTRDIETTVLLVCLAEGGPWDTALRGAAPRTPELSRREVSALIRRSVSVSDRAWVHRLLAQDVPAAFARVPQLRSARLAWFDQDGLAWVGDHGLRLDPELGLILREEIT